MDRSSAEGALVEAPKAPAEGVGRVLDPLQKSFII